MAIVDGNGTRFRVWVDTPQLEVTPSGTAKRSIFDWKDWAFENAGGEVASVLAVACVLAQAG